MLLELQMNSMFKSWLQKPCRNKINIVWEAIDQENDAIEKAKKSKVNFEFKTLSNGDTLKQLLQKSLFLIKPKSKWTQN